MTGPNVPALQENRVAARPRPPAPGAARRQIWICQRTVCPQLSKPSTGRQHRARRAADRRLNVVYIIQSTIQSKVKLKVFCRGRAWGFSPVRHPPQIVPDAFPKSRVSGQTLYMTPYTTLRRWRHRTPCTLAPSWLRRILSCAHVLIIRTTDNSCRLM